MRSGMSGVVVLLLAVGMSACASGGKGDPIVRMSSSEALAKGKELMEQEKYRQAREYLIHAFEVEPNSVGGREALLLAADSHYLQGGLDNFVRAEGKYRDFQTRFPTSNRAAYVQYQIASSLSKRIAKPDRDQKNSHQAVEEFQAVVELYPTSEYASLATAEIRKVRQSLATHEMLVGYFYMRYGNLNGATSRLEHILEAYPDFEETDRVLYYLGMTYRKSEREEDSRQTFDRLVQTFPESPYIKRIPKPRRS